MNKIGVILKINIKSAILIMNNFWCKKLHPTGCSGSYAKMLLTAMGVLKNQQAFDPNCSKKVQENYQSRLTAV